MLGKLVPYGNIPFFWTRHYNKGVQYVGNGSNFDETYVTGSIPDSKYVVYYIKNNKVLAAAG